MAAQPLPAVTTIVTHPGEAHRDDLMAVAVLLAHFPRAAVVRRDPTPDELADPTVAVVDVGLAHDPDRMTFDHHQFPRDHEPVCALTLVLDRLGLLGHARAALPWLGPTEVLDSKGPAPFARLLGMPADRLHLAFGPVEGFVLRAFAGLSALAPDEPHHDLLLALGRDVVNYVTRFAARQELLAVKATVHLVPCGGGRSLEVVDAAFIPPADNPVLGLEAWVKANYPAAAVTVTRDDRGDGLAVFRRNDHPRIDFSVLEGTAGCVFAHKNGFVAKLAAGVDPLAAVARAVRPAVQPAA